MEEEEAAQKRYSCGVANAKELMFLMMFFLMKGSYHNVDYQIP